MTYPGPLSVYGQRMSQMIKSWTALRPCNLKTPTLSEDSRMTAQSLPISSITTSNIVRRTLTLQIIVIELLIERSVSPQAQPKRSLTALGTNCPASLTQAATFSGPILPALKRPPAPRITSQGQTTIQAPTT